MPHIVTVSPGTSSYIQDRNATVEAIRLISTPRFGYPPSRSWRLILLLGYGGSTKYLELKHTGPTTQSDLVSERYNDSQEDEVEFQFYPLESAGNKVVSIHSILLDNLHRLEVSEGNASETIHWCRRAIVALRDAGILEWNAVKTFDQLYAKKRAWDPRRYPQL